MRSPAEFSTRRAVRSAVLAVALCASAAHAQSGDYPAPAAAAPTTVSRMRFSTALSTELARLTNAAPGWGFGLTAGVDVNYDISSHLTVRTGSRVTRRTAPNVPSTVIPTAFSIQHEEWLAEAPVGLEIDLSTATTLLPTLSVDLMPSVVLRSQATAGAISANLFETTVTRARRGALNLLIGTGFGFDVSGYGTFHLDVKYRHGFGEALRGEGAGGRRGVQIGMRHDW